MKYIVLGLAVLAASLSPLSIHAQTMRPIDPVHLDRANEILAEELFARLQAGEADALAEWVTDQTHSEASGTTRLQSLGQFQSQFRMILQGGANSPFGAMDGYDLIQQSTLPGTNRYFRLVYMSYHRGAPLLWEVHFYVKPDDDLAITYFQFNGQNPFTYMTSPDMLIERYYNPY